MEKTEKRPAMRLTAIAAVLAAALLPSLAACGGNDTAAAIHLRRAEGTVAVSDGGGKDIPVFDHLGLYSGYGVSTRSDSYAWIDLDDVKLTKMDQNSEISIEKEGKKLNIEVKSGSLFFNVTQPLEDGEAMSIRTSTMLVGIRGTCGWVEARNGLSRVYLLEGKVECSAGDQSVRVNAGEMAELGLDGELAVKEFTRQDIPAFVRDEADPDLTGGVNETDPGSSGGVNEAPGPDGPEDSGPVYRYPVQELSAEHRAFLDEVRAAMDASDLDALELLVQNDMVREIMVDVYTPYAHRLAEEYDEFSYLSEDDGFPGLEDDFYREGSSYSAAYTGEVFSVEMGVPVALEITYFGAYNDQTQERRTYTSFALYGDDGMTGNQKMYDVSTSFVYLNGKYHSGTSMTWKDESFQLGGNVPVGEWVLIQRDETDDDRDYGDGNRSGRAEIQLRGEFRMEPDEYGWLRPCLENGQVTLSHTDGSGRSGYGTIDVVDGYVVRQDGACRIEYTGGWWRVRLDIGNSNFHYFSQFMNSGSGEMQDGLLYHLFGSSESWSPAEDWGDE